MRERIAASLRSLSAFYDVGKRKQESERARDSGEGYTSWVMVTTWLNCLFVGNALRSRKMRGESGFGGTSGVDPAEADPAVSEREGNSFRARGTKRRCGVRWSGHCCHRTP